ncbi:MAG: hypothetical protein AAFR04_04235 [Pseudomonadota bacterium]
MMAHVAQADEARGRVVLAVRRGRVHPIALRASLLMAQAYHAEIESLFIEDTALFEARDHAFVSVCDTRGGARMALVTQPLTQVMRHDARALERDLGALAGLAGVRYRPGRTRARPQVALVEACATQGPWNLVALGEAVGAASTDQVVALLDEVPDTTGVLMVGPLAKRATGPLVVVLDDVTQVQAALRLADAVGALTSAPRSGPVPPGRKASRADRRSADVDTPTLTPNGAPNGPIAIVTGTDADAIGEIEGQLRLAPEDTARFARITPCVLTAFAPGALAECVRRVRPGLVAARAPTLTSTPGVLRALLASLEAPLLLMR